MTDSTSWTFLVVDDQQNILAILRNILKGNGFKKVFLAESGHEALRKLKENLVNFVITDWNMPRMNGIELISLIKNDPERFDIPVLMVADEIDKAKILYAIEEGADGYELKPFTETHVIQTIRSIQKKTLDQNPVKRKVQDAFRLMLKKNYDEALKTIVDVLKTEQNPDACFIASMCCFNRNEYENAKKFITRAIVMNKSSKNYHMLGKIFYAEKDIDRTIECFKAANAINPLNMNRKIELGDVYLKKGDLAEAEAIFKSVERAGATDLNFINIAKAYVDDKDVEKAGEYLNKTREPIPDTMAVYNQYAIELRKAKKFTEALDVYKKCLDLFPKNYSIHHNIGVLYMQTHNFQKAKIAFEKCLSLNPESPDVKEYIAYIDANM